MRKNITLIVLLSVAVLFSCCGQSQQHPQDFAPDTVLPAHRLTDSTKDERLKQEIDSLQQQVEKVENYLKSVPIQK